VEAEPEMAAAQAAHNISVDAYVRTIPVATRRRKHLPEPGCPCTPVQKQLVLFREEDNKRAFKTQRDATVVTEMQDLLDEDYEAPRAQHSDLPPMATLNRRGRRRVCYPTLMKSWRDTYSVRSQ
jgi:hypothetical protein